MKFKNLEVVLNTIDNGILLLNEELEVLCWNLWLETRTGIKANEIQNKSILEFFPEVKKNILKRKIRTVFSLNSATFYNAENSSPFIKIKQPMVSERNFTFMQQSVTIVPYDIKKRIVCIYVYDNTRLSEQNLKLKQLTEKLENEIVKNKEKDKMMYEQSKMAALGDMIQNIAHQWRQPLSIISTTASGIAIQKKMNILDDSSLVESMNTINNSSQYLSKIIDTFRSFVNKNKEYKVVNITNEIKEAIDIVSTSLKYNEIELIITNDCLNTDYFSEIVAYELPEAIINIINNAKDAIVENKIKNPWIKLNIKEENKRFYISIEDNAGGIDENIISKIYEPYFTTKYNSCGTGLGLHISYRILKESLQGNISVTNTKNGAKFVLDFPKN